MRGHGPASREPMAARDDEHQLVLHPRLRNQPGHERCLADHSQLQLTRRHPALDLAGVADLETQGERGMSCMKPAECGGKEVRAGRRARPDGQSAAAQPPQVSRSPLGAAHQPHRLAGVRFKQAGRGRRSNAPPVAFEQLNAEVGAEALKVFRDRGLADVAGLGRPTHAPLVEDREKQL